MFFSGTTIDIFNYRGRRMKITKKEQLLYELHDVNNDYAAKRIRRYQAHAEKIDLLLCYINSKPIKEAFMQDSLEEE